MGAPPFPPPPPPPPQAIALANDSAYGLTSYVQTTDTARARRVSRALRAGMVEVNGKACCYRSDR